MTSNMSTGSSDHQELQKLKHTKQEFYHASTLQVSYVYPLVCTYDVGSYVHSRLRSQSQYWV